MGGPDRRSEPANIRASGGGTEGPPEADGMVGTRPQPSAGSARASPHPSTGVGTLREFRRRSATAKRRDTSFTSEYHFVPNLHYLSLSEQLHQRD